MITYTLLLSEHFLKAHPRAGEPTNFVENFRKTKLHTIRGNYELWRKRFEKIERGEACLSVRVWDGAPFASSQRVIANLGKDDGIGLQLLQFKGRTGFTWIGTPYIDHQRLLHYVELANNDGLSFVDWANWFSSSDIDLTEDFAIIHFTDFRYN